MNGRLRIAWTGPVGGAGGVPGMGTLMLSSLLELGVEVDLYLSGTSGDLPDVLRDRPGLTVTYYDSGWRWGRWYSHHFAAAFITGSPARMWAHTRLSLRLWRNHQRQPYDCIFQLSQPELLALAWLRSSLPPTVVHPCSHAAGELRWHRLESRYARKLEPLWLHLGARLMLIVRSRLQRRSFQKPDLVVGPSARFIELLSADYAVPAERLRLLRHPVNLKGAQPCRSPRPPDRRIELLYVSRISSRKGVDLIVGLSQRLRDLAGLVHITIIGEHTPWSDYRRALERLDPALATYAGFRPFATVLDLYRTADALLVPSRYEPGSLVVGEALANGVPVVASDEVGPSEVVSPKCMRTFPAGDLDAFELEVRELVPELRSGFAALSACARQQAEQWFGPAVIAHELASLLREARGDQRDPVAAGGAA